MSQSTSPTPAVAALAAALGVAVAGLLPVTAGAAPKAPELSIAVDNQQGATTAGAALSYTVTVTNLGSKAVKDLVISQTVPTGAAFTKADSKGEMTSGAVRWEVDLPAAGSKTFRTSMTVSEATPAELLRLATVACAATSPKAAALVCASDSDQLPAGAAAEQQQLASAAPTLATGWYYAAAAVALVGSGVVVRALTGRGRAPRLGRRGAAG